MGFSEQLKKARLSLGLTQQQVAEAMGITNSTYSGYETGKRQPDVLKVKRLADILHTSGDVLLETGLGTDSEEKSAMAAAVTEAAGILETLDAETLKCAIEMLRALKELQDKKQDGGAENDG